MADRPSIVVHGFKTTYEKSYLPDGKPTGKRDRPVDWVSFSPAHSAMYTVITERVDWLKPDQAKIKSDDENGSKKLEFMRYRWDMIERAYTAWKSGHEIPVDGIPLGAWPGLNTAQADEFRKVGIKSVEQIAQMPDSLITRIQLPGVREIIAQARTFLDAADRNSTAARLNDLEGQNRELAEKLEAAMALLEEKAGPAPRKARKEVAEAA